MAVWMLQKKLFQKIFLAMGEVQLCLNLKYFFFTISCNVNSMLKMLRLSVQCQNRLDVSENWKFELFKHNPDVWLLIIFQERGNLCNAKFIHAYFICVFPITELKISNICFPQTDNVLNYKSWQESVHVTNVTGVF